MITTAVYIASAIAILVTGCAIGALIALNYATRELIILEEKYKNTIEAYKDIANTAMRCASKYETRCKELESKYGELHVQ